MSSSAICQNFVQNAWKKELCSNCFKSKDEHSAKPKPKPVQLISTKEVIGIIRNGDRSRPKMSVCFLKELTEVIGYGGDDWYSDTEDEVDENESSSDGYISTDSEGEECHEELKKITKANTDFNTTSLGDTEPKRSFTQLLLGKPLVDSSGKKQTLLVSVTPFGEEPSSPVRKSNTKSFSHIPIAKNKEVIAENKNSNVVLTSYTKNEEKEEKSLLDEINETLESGRNPISIMSKKKKIEKEIVLSVSELDKENLVQERDKNDDEIEEGRVQKVVVSEKKINLTRTPALKRDVEKPVIYQTSTAKIELMNSRNLKLNKETTNNKAKNDSTLHISKNEVNNNTTSENKEIKKEVVEVTKTKEKKDEINANVAEKGESVKEDKLAALPPPVPAKSSLVFTQSREQAGKPDGREDPLSSEVPPLPVTPPPVLETQTSFLHGPAPNPPIYEKPKIPVKPAANMLIRKPQIALSTFSSDPVEKQPLTKQDSGELDGKSGKRKAPMPPDDGQGPIYTRNNNALTSTDGPVVKEKDKRDRASSCAPKLTASLDEVDYASPEPAPRKSLSISTDCLATEEKRKQKARFSLKKFLRMGSSKDVSKLGQDETTKTDEKSESQSNSKPRLVIVHPSELNGSKVEVVATPVGLTPPKSPLAPPTPTSAPPSPTNHDYASADMGGDYESYALSAPPKPAVTKPPPPPRNLEAGHAVRPPPKSFDVLSRQRQRAGSEHAVKKTETVYANIGEVRSAIVPNKPVRTASMREREAMQQKQMRKANHNYEPINIRGKDSTENVYDYINSTRSSSPDSDSSRGKGSPKAKNMRLGKRSESSIDVSSEYFKYGGIPRSMSLTYCGSETESEIYSPYGFYGSESEVTEDDHDWIQNGRTHKLRSRKGRSIVHKNLEDNYGAVVVANHEALAQVLENIQQSSHVQPALRGLKTAPSLRWSDFSVVSGPNSPVLAGHRAFHQSLWGTAGHHVTLCVDTGATAGAKGALALGAFAVQAVTEFSDLVPERCLAKGKGEDVLVQATISVLPWLQIHTFQSYSDYLKSKFQNPDEAWKDSNFVMLQLVNALKILQAQGIEELPVSLSCFVLCKEMEKDNHHRLCVLQPDLTTDTDPEKHATLCACALKALNLLQTSPKISCLLQSLLGHERAVSLTQVKSVLEFTLWGPSDVALGSTVRERELALQSGSNAILLGKIINLWMVLELSHTPEKTN
ncbi:unnamed protein product [Acanthoscelides obtectus]|uniref:Uncharacterized protein n=1 Tax=Acanthoscelides obtectus TaxID=200917 RepID=A0A9P0P5M6_ACAOB|nr:unnamed protein product [Acanthoscelides obtectus]CAK1622919.1 hypothetical protein AOBTE_LOCUS1731 [Acanthoscelides obtectus]